MNADLLWPRYATPGDLDAIERIPLADRGLPNSTYAALQRAAALWPDRAAVSGVNCISPWAFFGETARGSKFDSAAITASTSSPRRSAS